MKVKYISKVLTQLAYACCTAIPAWKIRQALSELLARSQSSYGFFAAVPSLLKASVSNQAKIVKLMAKNDATQLSNTCSWPLSGTLRKSLLEMSTTIALRRLRASTCPEESVTSCSLARCLAVELTQIPTVLWRLGPDRAVGHHSTQQVNRFILQSRRLTTYHSGG